MNKIHERYIEKPVISDLKSKMVFIGGPRQVGKTTLALSFMPEPNTKSPAYFNWDDVSDRSKLLRVELPPNEKIIILDACNSGGFIGSEIEVDLTPQNSDGEPGGGGELIEVPFDGSGPTPVFGAPQRLFAYEDDEPLVTPDGRFVRIEDETPAEGEEVLDVNGIVLVENWIGRFLESR